MNSLLQVARLEASYGSARILHGLDFALAAGRATALLGRNGAGKSTTLKALVGLVRHRGSVLWRGREIGAEPTHRIARAGIGWVPEDRRIFAGLTVEENLLVGRRPIPPGIQPWSLERVYALFPALAGLRRRQGLAISGGEQQMLTIARTLMTNPLLILLDEPSEGLAPRLVDQLAEALLALRQQGVALLVSEPNLTFARHVADDALVLERGQLRFAGPLAEVDARPDLREAYLAM